MKEETKRFEGLGTKIDSAMAEVLDACCNALGVDVYHLLQWFAYTIIRASAPMHELDPRIQKLMTLMESDAGWQRAFNLANPDRLKVSRVVLILEQQGHKGFGAVMIDKPWMGEARQTECVDEILERVCETTMRGIYRRLRQLGAKLECQNLSDVLLTLIDGQTINQLEEEFRAELPQMGNVADNGRVLAYGKKTKAKQKRTPDSVEDDHRYQQTRIIFDEDDKALAEMEANYKPEDWEGEIRQREEPPANMHDHDRGE
jgi:hypothetical protein